MGPTILAPKLYLGLTTKQVVPFSAPWARATRWLLGEHLIPKVSQVFAGFG